MIDVRQVFLDAFELVNGRPATGREALDRFERFDTAMKQALDLSAKAESPRVDSRCTGGGQFRIAPDVGELYFIKPPVRGGTINSDWWLNKPLELELLKKGLIYRSQSDVVDALRAM